MSQLILSIFPGIGLLDMAFEEEGFCVVRGPDLLWGGDVRRFHPPAGKFDGVIGGPPCQVFSRMRYINPLAGQKHGNMIPEFERVIDEALPRWFLMENVPEAPSAEHPCYTTQRVLVRDVWVGGETNRLRAFIFGTYGENNPRLDAPRLFVETLALHRTDPEPAVTASGATRSMPVALMRDGVGGHRLKRRIRAGDCRTDRSYREGLRLSGLPDDFLAEAPFTVAGKLKVIGNGVPLPMGRAIARAVKKATGI